MKRRFVQPLKYVAVLAVTIMSSVMMYITPAQESDAANPSSRLEAAQKRISDLAGETAYLADRQAIRDAGKRYTRGADRHDEELIRSAFWPDATASHGKPMERDEFVDWWLRELSGYAAHQHHITGQTVDIDGNTAHVESYVIYFHVPRDKSVDKHGPPSPGKALTSEKTYLGSGRYIERWEKRNGEWRVLVHEYVEDLALLGETVDYCEERTCLGTWDRSDLSYTRPLRHVTPEERRRREENSTRRTSPTAGDESPRSNGSER